MKILSCLAVLALAATLAHAYPDKPITVIVPFAAGGGADVIARALQPDMAKSLGQQLVILNRDGAAGTIGTAALFSAKPDGYTIGLIPAGPLVTQPHLRRLSYNAAAWQPICQAYDGGPNVLMVAPSSTFRSAKQVVDYAKANPGKLSYASPGPGSLPHLAMADFARSTATDILHVPYKGSAGVVQAMLGGHVQLYADQANVMVQANLRGLAVFNDTRLAELREIPTMKELDIPVGNYSLFGSFMAPRGLPEAALAKLEQACRDAVHAPAFKAFLQKQKLPFVYRGSEELDRHLRSTYARLGEVIKAAGIRPTD